MLKCTKPNYTSEMRGKDNTLLGHLIKQISRLQSPKISLGSVSLKSIGSIFTKANHIRHGSLLSTGTPQLRCVSLIVCFCSLPKRMKVNFLNHLQSQ